MSDPLFLAYKRQSIINKAAQLTSWAIFLSELSSTPILCVHEQEGLYLDAVGCLQCVIVELNNFKGSAAG